MFTGLIKGIGAVKSLKKGGAGARLAVDRGPLADGLYIGASVAIDGACLTATAFEKTIALFDVSAETLSRTTLGLLSAGDSVNIEPALAAGDPLGGHIVQGHVDGVGTLDSITPSGESKEYRFRAPREIIRDLITKGSIAVNGVSLTVTALDGGSFGVALIPHTLSSTTLGRMKPGDKVNIETDLIGKYVRRHLGASGGGLTEEKLREYGYID